MTNESKIIIHTEPMKGESVTLRHRMTESGPSEDFSALEFRIDGVKYEFVDFIKKIKSNMVTALLQEIEAAKKKTIFHSINGAPRNLEYFEEVGFNSGLSTAIDIIKKHI